MKEGFSTHRHAVPKVAGVHDQHGIGSCCRHFIAELNGT